MQLYVNLDKLLEGPEAIVPPPLQNYMGGGGLAPAGPPIPTPMLYFVRSIRHQSEL